MPCFLPPPIIAHPASPFPTTPPFPSVPCLPIAVVSWLWFEEGLDSLDMCIVYHLDFPPFTGLGACELALPCGGLG